MDKTTNLMFAGVGGQGSLLIAELTSLAASFNGYDVKQTEVHGVSQRGGSVETHVRFGQKIYSPVVTPGQADAVIALEKLEAVRFAHFVNPEEGLILINDQVIVPGSVTGAEDIYPFEAISFLEKKGVSIMKLSASQTAHNLGDGRMANVVMLGALSTQLDIHQEHWQKALRYRLPERYLEPNLKAFAAGQKAAKNGK